MNIFKNKMPIDILFNLFDKVIPSENNQYIVDKSVFKIISMNHYIEPFIKECMIYYSGTMQKKYLLKSPLTHKCFLTIVRQICKINNVPFYYKLKYSHSAYEIVYYINMVKV